MEENAAIQSIYTLALKISRDKPGSLGFITVDSESLHTCCTATFPLRCTDHFPLCSGCYITFEEAFTGPTRTLLTFIRQAEPQIHRNSCHAWFDSTRLHPGLLSITHPTLMRRRRLDSLCQRRSTRRHSAAETRPLPGVVICVDNSITVKCSDKFPCGGLEQSRSPCETLCSVSDGVLCWLILID